MSRLMEHAEPGRLQHGGETVTKACATVISVVPWGESAFIEECAAQSTPARFKLQ